MTDNFIVNKIIYTLTAYTRELWYFFIGLLLQFIWTLPRYLKPIVGAYDITIWNVEASLVVIGSRDQHYEHTHTVSSVQPPGKRKLFLHRDSKR